MENQNNAKFAIQRFLKKSGLLHLGGQKNQELTYRPSNTIQIAWRSIR